MNKKDIVVSVHQPNFFPWLGFFDKINRSDIFVLFDNVQFPRQGAGTWCNRVKMMNHGRAQWWTMPIQRSFHGTKLINEITINDTVSWRENSLKLIQENYKKAAHFHAVFSMLQEMMRLSENGLAAFNQGVIKQLLQCLGWESKKVVLASQVDAQGQATDLLISLVKKVGGKAYLSGDGSSGYLEENKFKEAGLELIYQKFQHPVYEQGHHQNFIPGLSILDALFHLGFDGVRKLLNG